MGYRRESTKTAVIIKDIYGLKLCLDLSPFTLLLVIVIVPAFYAKQPKHCNCVMIWKCISPLWLHQGGTFLHKFYIDFVSFLGISWRLFFQIIFPKRPTL